MSGLIKSRQLVLDRLSAALHAAGRADDACRLIAVSKTFPAEDIRELYAGGQRSFGENYVQELEAKSLALRDLPALEWHFIGPLQSNKTRSVANIAHWVHTIDRLKIAERLSAQRSAGLPPLQVCVQVNVSAEASKSGCQPDDAVQLCESVAGLSNLRLRGLMCIPAVEISESELERQFVQLVMLKDDINRKGFDLDTLSMGMSADLEIAVRHGSTLIRIGTAIFGKRHYTGA